MKKFPSSATIEEQPDRDELPEGWESCGMEDISELVTSGSRDWSKFYSNKGAYFVRSAEINDYTLRISEAIRVALPARVEGKRSLIEKDDILVTITGANVGKCARVDSVIPEAYVSQSVALIKLKQKNLAPFVYYAMRAPNFAGGQLTNMAYGMGRPVLSLPQIKSLRIPLAPLVEQNRILGQIQALLSRVGTANQRLARVPKILKAFRQSVLSAACSGRLTEDWRVVHPEAAAVQRPATNWECAEEYEADNERFIDSLEPPENWRADCIGQVAEVKGGKRLPKGMGLVDNDTGFPYIRATNLKEGIVTGEILYLPLSIQKRIARYIVRSGDVYITIVGACIGDAGIIPQAFDQANLTENAAKITNFRGLYGPFLSVVLRSPPMQREIEDRIHSASQGKLALHRIATLPTPLPPIEEQKEIVRQVETLFKLADKIEEHVAGATKRADKLTLAILAKAFRGELVPTEAELACKEGRDYEPASVLLERIEAEREAVKPSNGVNTFAKRGSRPADKIKM